MLRRTKPAASSPKAEVRWGGVADGCTVADEWQRVLVFIRLPADEVVAAADEPERFIEAVLPGRKGRSSAEMPFANPAGAIARFLKILRQ